MGKLTRQPRCLVPIRRKLSRTVETMGLKVGDHVQFQAQEHLTSVYNVTVLHFSANEHFRIMDVSAVLFHCLFSGSMPVGSGYAVSGSGAIRFKKIVKA